MVGPEIVFEALVDLCSIAVTLSTGCSRCRQHHHADDGTPKITDWGLGKSITDTRQSQVIGYSPAYAAPEQLAPHLYVRPGTWTEIYQSGVLLFEMLIGTTPFEQEGVADMNRAILYEKPQIPVSGGEHEEAIKKILLKCLEKKPANRYDSVNSRLADLAALDSSP